MGTGKCKECTGTHEVDCHYCKDGKQYWLTSITPQNNGGDDGYGDGGNGPGITPSPGDGKRECGGCKGAGKRECGGCKGSGDCQSCDGQGVYWYSYLGETILKECGTCFGDGDCNICDGRGEKDCSSCGGKGYK